MDTFIAVFYLVLLFILIVGFIFLGMLISKWLRMRHAGDGGEDNKIIEGAVLGLMGLLIALSFTSAYERFNISRTLVIREASAIQKLYLRSFVLPQPLQAKEQTAIKNYLALRIFFYRFFSDKTPTARESRLLFSLEKQIWLPAVDYCVNENNSTLCSLFLESANEMFATAHERIEMTFIHPPIVIFVMLVILAFLSAMLCGYNLRKKIIKHSLHLLSYALIITMTIYIVIDLEYPRFGFLKADYFGYILKNELIKLYEYQKVG